jgi:purine-binding chemotaxis protein CheW
VVAVAPAALKAPVVRPPVTPPPVVQAEVEVETIDAEADIAEMAPPQAWPDNGRPQWAQQPFECLLFKVGGLALAVPLVELGAIYPLETDLLTSIFGQADWFMGLLPVKDYNVRTVDSARVVMPERYREEMRAGYRYVITLNGTDWGLAVDQVANAVLLDPEQVRWRGQRSQRPWLAGTVVAHMCALLDVAQLAWMFHNQDRKRRAPRR